MMKRPLTATGLRAILVVSLFVTSLAGGAVFYFVNTKLEFFAIEVSRSNVDAASSSNNLQNLQQVKTYLEQKQDVVTRTNSIVADSQSYQYQNQIITDLNDFAKRSSIAITNIDFSTGTSSGSAPANGSAGTAPITTTPTPAGVKSISVSVTVKNPVDYNNMLRFIKSIEENLTKMQISKIGLSKTTDSSGVTSDILTIEVYVR